MTPDMWCVTHDMRYVTCDTWHLTHGGGSQYFSSPAFTVWDWQCLEDSEYKRRLNKLTNEIMNYKDVYKTAYRIFKRNWDRKFYILCQDVLSPKTLSFFFVFTNYASQCQGQGRDWTGQGRDEQGQTWTSRASASTSLLVRVCPCLFLLITVYPCLSLSFPVCPCLSKSLHVRPCLSLSVPVCPCLSLSVPVFPCLSLSVPVSQCPTMSVPVFQSW